METVLSGLPPDWGCGTFTLKNKGSVAVGGGGVMEGPASDGKLADSIDAGTIGGDEEDSKPAECVGHSLSDRGLWCS